MSKRSILITAALAVSVALVIAALVVQQRQTQVQATTGSIELIVVPRTATLTLDGKTQIRAGVHNLAPGDHKITAAARNFTTETQSFKITKGERITRSVILSATNDEGRRYLSLNTDEVTKAEGTVGKQIEEEGERITQNNPLIELLPYHGFDFDISAGLSKAHPNESESVGIYIKAPTEAGKTHARNWIKAQGYDPAAYELIYQ